MVCRNVDFGDILTPEIKAKHQYTTYDLVANIVHDGEPGQGTYRVHILHKATGQWYELQDLHVTQILPQMITLTEAYIQVNWKGTFIFSCLCCNIGLIIFISFNFFLQIYELRKDIHVEDEDNKSKKVMWRAWNKNMEIKIYVLYRLGRFDLLILLRYFHMIFFSHNLCTIINFLNRKLLPFNIF